ncbi:unnamed protein product [Durusdinium trenchii]|uniref:Uncharacterized protein n=1 Tax=Durusdinium trenchii TaxID=1381693 RepID=A0ABP0KTY2_9DINO
MMGGAPPPPPSGVSRAPPPPMVGKSVPFPAAPAMPKPGGKGQGAPPAPPPQHSTWEEPEPAFPKRQQGTPAPKSHQQRRAKQVTGNSLQFKNHYQIPLTEKFKTLQAMDSNQFSNSALGALSNEEVTDVLCEICSVDPESKPMSIDNDRAAYLNSLCSDYWRDVQSGDKEEVNGKYLIGLVKHNRKEKERILGPLRVYPSGDRYCVSNSEKHEYLPRSWNAWDETVYWSSQHKKPYVSNQDKTAWVEEFVPVSEYRQYEARKGPDSLHSLSLRSVNRAARSETSTSFSSEFNHIVVYAPDQTALLVDLHEPQKSSYLPECPAMDYAVSVTKRDGETKEYVTSPTVPLSVFASELMEKQQSMPALKDTEPSAKRLRVLAPQESKASEWSTAANAGDEASFLPSPLGRTQRPVPAPHGGPRLSQEEIDRIRLEVRQRKDAQDRQEEENRKKAQEEARIQQQQEEARKKEEERVKREKEARLQQEEEETRKKEEERIKREEEARVRQEEEEARRQKEEESIKREEEARIRQEEEEARCKKEEERIKQEEEEARIRQEEEQARKKEEERVRQEEEERMAQEEAWKKKDEEESRRKEEMGERIRQAREKAQQELRKKEEQRVQEEQVRKDKKETMQGEGPTPGYPLQGKAKTIPAPPSVTKKVEKK